jgi:hypothetical protein
MKTGDEVAGSQLYANEVSDQSKPQNNWRPEACTIWLPAIECREERQRAGFRTKLTKAELRAIEPENSRNNPPGKKSLAKWNHQEG